MDRWGWGALIAGSASVLLASFVLTPSATNVGTHTQLGLPPCGFLLLFGKPCPACGLTTAFAHFAHLDVLASLRAHPLGVPLFLATLVVLGGAVRGLIMKRPLSKLLAGSRPLWVASALSLALLLVWVVRLSL